jgi:hypothetical protein
MGGSPMHYTDPLTIEKLSALRVDTAQRQARSDELLHQLGLKKQESLSLRRQRFLTRVGRQLMVLGRWIEQCGSPRPSY